MDIQVLVDGGSSDNFLQPCIAKFLKLPVEEAPMFRVIVSNGNIMKAKGIVKNLVVNMQGHTIQLPVYLLPILGADLILSASWLATLKTHLADYDALQLKFFQQGKLITLQGDPRLIPTAAQFNHI